MNTSRVKVINAKSRYPDPSLPPDALVDNSIKWGIPDKYHVRIYLNQKTYLKTTRYAGSDTSREVGGLLLGRLFKKDSYYCVLINDFVPDHEGRGTANTYSFTRESWSRLISGIEDKYPDSRIVGWFHSHPNFGAFFSSVDNQSQITYFPQPWMIGLVVDPIRNESAFFSIPPGAAFPLRILGFYEGPIQQGSKSIVTWKNWQTADHVHDREAAQLKEEMYFQQQPSLPTASVEIIEEASTKEVKRRDLLSPIKRVSPWFGIYLIGFILVLLFAVSIIRLNIMEQRIDVIEKSNQSLQAEIITLNLQMDKLENYRQRRK